MLEQTQESTATDTELIGSTLAGDLAAFGVLTQRYWSLAMAVALSRLENAAEAEDMAQESFIRAHRGLASLCDPSRFVGWLSRIVVQQCVDAHRQHSVLKKPWDGRCRWRRSRRSVRPIHRIPV
jgi:RNA polymerase sigma factor (sigma-70 family)